MKTLIENDLLIVASLNIHTFLLQKVACKLEVETWLG
jgi:hypothetical protein